MEEIVIEDDATIRSYFVTQSSKYVLYTRLCNTKSSKNIGELILYNFKEKKTTQLDIIIPISESNFDFELNYLSIVDVPKISFKQENAKVTKVSWIAFNTGDSICIISFDDVSTCEIVTHKWFIENARDCITSFNCKADNNGNIRILYSTKLGNLTYAKFNTMFKRWSLIKKFDDFASDSLSFVSFGYSGLQAKWEDRIGDIDNALVSGFDNNLRFLVRQKGIDFRVENETLYSTFKTNNVLTCADYQIVKSRSPTSFTAICCGNVTNLGCTVYKRSNRGEWVFLAFLDKIIDKEETISTVNCQVVLGLQESEVVIYSGSENGKLYEWTFNWKENIIIKEDVHIVGGKEDVIHKLMCINGSVYYLVNSERIGRIT